MSSSEFPQAVVDVIRRCASNFPAVELLVFLATNPAEFWRIDDLVEKIKPRTFSASSVAQHLSRFEKGGLVKEVSPGCFRYSPATPEHADSVKMLTAAYNERPVTLIRLIYELEDHSIQSFADSFRLKNN